MNFTLKALVAAVALVAAGSANATFLDGSSGNGELALYVFDTTSNKTFAMDLPAIGADTFTTTSILTAANASWTVGGADWTKATTAFANTDPSLIKWAVLSFDSTGVSQVAGTNVINTTAVVGTDVANFDVQNGTLQNAKSRDKNWAANTALNTKIGGVVAADPTFFSGTSATATFANITTEYVGQSDTDFWNVSNTTLNKTSEFWSVTGDGEVLHTQKTLVGTFTFDYIAGSLAFVKNVPTTIVPESDTYAMLLAGLGVMGLVARRRLAA